MITFNVYAYALAEVSYVNITYLVLLSISVMCYFILLSQVTTTMEDGINGTGSGGGSFVLTSGCYIPNTM